MQPDFRRPEPPWPLLLVAVATLMVSAVAFAGFPAPSTRSQGASGGGVPGPVPSPAPAMDRSLALGSPADASLIPLGIVVLLALFSLLLFSRITRARVLDHDRRRAIYEHVVANPGVHFRQLRDTLGLGTGVVMHHLGTLERERLIRSLRLGGRRVYFDASARVDMRDARDLIVEEVRREPGITQSEIALRLEMSRMLVHYYVKSLQTAGRIATRADGRRVGLYTATA